MTIFSSLFGGRLDRELGTNDTNLFTTAKRQAAINEAQVEFNDLTECFTKRVTFNCTGGTAEYDLNSSNIGSTDFVRFSAEPVTFIYTDASSNQTFLAGEDTLPRRDIVWLDRHNAGWRNDTHASSVIQLPAYHYLRRDGPALFLGLTPKPCTGSSASAQLLVPYVALPQPMTSTGDEPFTANSSVRVDLRPYHQALVHYAAHQLEKLRRDDQASDRQLQKFLGYVARYMQNMRVKGGRAISQARSYFVRGG